MSRPDLVVRNTTHGMSNTRVYRIYKLMRQRCYSKTYRDYKDYGGRGITICERWNKFENFYRDMGDPPTINYSINRLDNNGDYTPENCVWATNYEQAQNKRNSRLVMYREEVKPLVVWTRELHLDYTRTRQRLDLGWSVERAFT